MNLVPQIKVLQIGTGKLLRGLFDPLWNTAAGITVVQSRDEAAALDHINQTSAGYHLWVRGYQHGQVVEEVHNVRSLGHAYSMTRQWNEILKMVADPLYGLIVSNTTEKGLRLEPDDAGLSIAAAVATPPRSFPARLLALLHQRYQHDETPVAILPLELIENNAAQLQQLVLEQAELWDLNRDVRFIEWLQNDCRWLATLVDRICVDVVPPVPWSGDDLLAVMTEPFQMLVVQRDGRNEGILPSHPAVIWADDLRPYFLQKVRLLNGLHTAMVARCLPLGFAHVIDVMNDPIQARWVEELLRQELVPTLEGQGLQVREFGEQVLDRFRNPFFRHRLADIAVGHEMKLRVRLQPTLAEYHQQFGQPPERLTEVLQLPLPV
jgi:tagaturonate reductase